MPVVLCQTRAVLRIILPVPPRLAGATLYNRSRPPVIAMNMPTLLPQRCYAGALILTLSLALGACAGAGQVAEPPASERAMPIPTHENLNSTLWIQTAVEYRGLALQAYATAGLMLDRALADTSWTAALEQAETAGYGRLRPAVVLDVDETVLDNSAYQARLVRDDAVYASDTWAAWVEEAQATPVPGAVAFTQEAVSKGIAVVYLTNRRAEQEAATRRNLAAYGFPVEEGYDAVITRGERPEWASGDKASRRRAVAETFRLLLLVGDNLGDFMGEVEAAPAERAAMAAPYEAFWGSRWILLPNPQYGSWEGALFDYDYRLSREQQRLRKYEALDTHDRR